MIYRGDNGIKLVFTVRNDNNELVDLTSAFIEFQMVTTNNRVKKVCTVDREATGKCFCVLTKEDTIIPGTYKYQLTVCEGASVFTTSSGKFKILDRV